MEDVVNVFIEELSGYEILQDGKPTGLIEIERAEGLMKLLAIAVKNECDCEDAADLVDRGKTYNTLRQLA